MHQSGNRPAASQKSSEEWQSLLWLPRGIPLAILVLFLWCSAAVGEETDSSKRPKGYAKFESALQSQMHTASELPQPDASTTDSPDYNVRILTALAVCAAFGLRLLLPRMGKLFNQRAAAAAGKAGIAELQKTFVEQEFFAQFAGELKSASEANGAADQARREALEEFYKTTPQFLATLRERFTELSRSLDVGARQKSLSNFSSDIETFRTKLGTFEFVPAWQIASGLQKLISQLAEKPANFTPSALRTVAGGLLLLNDLCVPDVRKDLATNPPVRFLAVDDDPISRRAVSMSLKKIAQAPDLAEHGEAALQLAERQAYDAVFLDVEMPGLDGFEVCTRIHQLPANRLTPVVFVTGHDDFESRAKSTSSGGRDLIAKPFLSAEITVKALTLLLRGRLDRERARREELAKETSPVAKTEIKAIVAGKVSAPARSAESRTAASKVRTEAKAAAGNNEKKPESAGEKIGGSLMLNPVEFAKAFAEHGAEHLREMQQQISALGVAKSAAERQEVLGELYVGINVVRSEAARAGLKASCELASALAKLVSKLLDKPALYTPSVIQSTSAAIALLEEFARGGVEADVPRPSVRVLVVDDEPLARRAITNALQLAFGKPDSAESGEAALALAQTKIFDVIFLDIMMPEMDGFETCSKIRETGLNGTTPMIFVTSQKDTESREKAFETGGNGFISKPVLPAEIFLTALTFALRGRMEKGDREVPAEKLEAVLC